MTSIRRLRGIAAPRGVVSHNAEPSQTQPTTVMNQAVAHFTIFPCLPLEIKQMIWTMACQTQREETRLLRVAPDPDSCERTSPESRNVKLGIISDASRAAYPIPSMLHACSYSRSLTKK